MGRVEYLEPERAKAKGSHRELAEVLHRWGPTRANNVGWSTFDGNFVIILALRRTGSPTGGSIKAWWEMTRLPRI
jgi:hypothetical protein